MTDFQRIIKYCAIAFGVFLTVSIIGGICGALGMVAVFFDGDRTAAGEMKTYTVGDEIENLYIEVSAAEIEIISGEKFSVDSNHKYLSVEEDNNTLRITEEKKIFGVSSKGVSVVLTIPEDHVFEDADIAAGAGKVHIDTLSTNTLMLDLGAGKSTIDDLNVMTRACINGDTGKVKIKNSRINDLDMDVGVGKLTMTSALTGTCKVDYGIGKAELTLVGNKEDYQIKLDKGVGEATLDGKRMNDGSVYGGGHNRIDIDGGVGSIQIEFEEE
ncbi:MAG: DUF4097 family beta strand repeat protein [Eubacterium sp.]|nr:DUF4097 family beta strand repeat protein [Eubacterium sp.]